MLDHKSMLSHCELPHDTQARVLNQKVHILSNLHMGARHFHHCLLKPMMVTFSGLFKGKNLRIYGDFISCKLFNTVLGAIHTKTLGSFVTPSGAVQNSPIMEHKQKFKQ